MGIIALGLVVAYGILFFAGQNRYKGLRLADQVCNQADLLCANPSWIGIAAASFVILFVWRQADKT
jgi:hypothetical protein